MTYLPIALDGCAHDCRSEGRSFDLEATAELLHIWCQALQHILHKSGYNYLKRRDLTKLSETFAGGPGISSVQGNALCPALVRVNSDIT